MDPENTQSIKYTFSKLFQQVLVKVKTTFLYKSKCAWPSRAHSHGHTYARTQIYCRYSSKQVALTPSVYCAVLIFIYVNCVMVTGEALQLVSQTSTEKRDEQENETKKTRTFYSKLEK